MRRRALVAAHPQRRDTQAQRLLRYLRKKAFLRSADLGDLGVPREVLRRLVASGEVERVGRGVYALAGADLSEAQAIVQAQLRVPQAVVCLLSALQFHELTTQLPHEVWIAVSRKARKPKVDYPPLRVVRFSGRALTQGIREHVIDRHRVSITTPARTVADCFKYRNKVGLDVALEALKDYRRRRAGTIDELWEAAKLDRVERVLRPYLEAIG
jgi:predicted transcriptional regulator of viral defense system